MGVERRHHGHSAPNSLNTFDGSLSPSLNGSTTSTVRRNNRVRRKKKKTSSLSSSCFGRLPTTITLGVWSSRALLCFVAAIYSTNFACIKYLETVCEKEPCDHDPAEASFCRFLVSALVCLPILYSNRHHVDIIKAGIEVGFWVSVHYVAQAESLEYIGAGKCAFICALEVVTVPLLAAFFLGRPIRPMALVSAAIALFGVAILENLIPLYGTVSETPSPASPNHPTMIFGIGKGDLIALVQPFAFGYAMMRIEYHIERFSHVPNRVLTITAAQCTTVFAFSFAWLLYDGGGHLPDLTYMLEPHRLITLGWTGIITTVIAIILQGIALQKASAADAALIFSSDPVWSSLFAVWLLNETLSPTTYVGGAFILTACVIGSVSSARAATEHGGASSSSSSSSTTNPRQRLKHKSSALSDAASDVDDDHSNDMLLPLTTTNHSAKGGGDFSASTLSVQSMTDVRQFPRQ